MSKNEVMDKDALPAGESEGGPEAQISGESLAEMKEQAARATQYYEQLMRTAADLENYKKRAARERQEAIKYANESLLEKIIPILDNFEMAQAAANAPSTSLESLQSGISMIQQQLRSAMAEVGLEEIDASGKAFDPNLHEALSQVETTDFPEGHVAQQLRKGYKLRERLLRPASVVVAKTPAA